MNKCAFCGAETELYHGGVPICQKCAEDYERLVQEKGKDKPLPEDLSGASKGADADLEAPAQG